jgi:hypothetical protein
MNEYKILEQVLCSSSASASASDTIASSFIASGLGSS